MNGSFYRPVDDRFPVLAHFAEWGTRWFWYVDPDTGMWIPRGSAPGLRGQHKGVDFDCPKGSVVCAVSDGIIAKARFESPIDSNRGAGLYIIQLVQMHGHDAWWMKYSHLKAVYVQVGDEVKRGQPIAESGDSGEVERPLLHVDLADTKHPPQYHPIIWGS